VALCPDVASLTVNQFDCCNLLWRRVIRYGTGKTSYWRLLTLSLLKTSSGARDEVLGKHTAVGNHNGLRAFS